MPRPSDIEEEIAQTIEDNVHLSPWDTERDRMVSAIVTALSPLLNRVRAEAQEAAYRHAAEVVHAEARWQWEKDRGHVPGAQIVAQRMQVIEACLTGFASRIEQSSEGAET